MSDEIVGIAILDDRCMPQRLHVMCRPAGKAALEWTDAQSIPVYPQGTPEPKQGGWSYLEEGDNLHCSPSLLVTYQLPPDQTWHERFHNGYNWSVKFRRAVTDNAHVEMLDANEVVR